MRSPNCGRVDWLIPSRVITKANGVHCGGNAWQDALDQRVDPRGEAQESILIAGQPTHIKHYEFKSGINSSINKEMKTETKE